jgi:hypothetical protein
MQTSSVSADQVSAVAALIDRLPMGTPTALDPSDPGHRAAIEASLAAAGRTQARYPALHQALGKPGDGVADAIQQIDSGADSAGRATATTWHAAGRGNLYSGGTLFALDAASHALLAMGHNSCVAVGFVPISTQSASAKPAGAALKTLSLNHTVMETGAVRFTALAGSNPIVDQGVTFNIYDPTLNPKKGPNVKIAVGRVGGNNGDVDYWYSERQDDPNPYLIAPFVGNATISYQIIGTPGQPISGAQLVAQIFFVTDSGTITVPMNSTYTKNFASKVTLDSVNPSKVNWSYPYTAGQSYTNTTSLVYEREPLVNDHESYFAFTFLLPVNGPQPNYPMTVCSKATPEPASPSCHKVLCNLTFTWHCLAAGTKVTLAGGGAAAIETLDNTCRVDTGGGRDLAVEATTFGTHEAKSDGPSAHAVYRLTTDGGHELVGTAHHPIQTPHGMVPLEALAKGATVKTAEGTATVASCTRIDFNGKMYNLKLGDESDRGAGLSDDAVCTYVANGIVVGDQPAQRHERRRRVRDMTYMAARLPKALSADYASAIEDIQY